MRKCRTIFSAGQATDNNEMHEHFILGT